MDIPMLHVLLTVGEVLQTWPQTFSIFMKHKMQCPGCFMQKFCTLKEVAETYQVSVEDLMEEIMNVSKENV
jgi:hybrid cluster-associated redox disulfide protein